MTDLAPRARMCACGLAVLCLSVALLAPATQADRASTIPAAVESTQSQEAEPQNGRHRARPLQERGNVHLETAPVGTQPAGTKPDAGEWETAGPEFTVYLENKSADDTTAPLFAAALRRLVFEKRAPTSIEYKPVERDGQAIIEPPRVLAGMQDGARPQGKARSNRRGPMIVYTYSMPRLRGSGFG